MPVHRAAAGSQLLMVDHDDGHVSDDDVADAFARTLASEWGRRASRAVEPLPDGFAVAGCCNGGGMAEHAVTRRPHRLR